MSNIPAGWYPDSQGNQRWWDGNAWTSHVAAAPASAPQETRRSRRAETPRATSETRGRHKKLSKIEARARVEELEAVVARHNARQFDDLDQYRDRAELEVRQIKQARDRLAIERAELEKTLVSLRDTADLQQAGLFDYEHPAEHSATLAAELESLRAQIKASVREKTATSATSNFTFNQSEAKGRKFVNDMSKILLRAFNAEAENCVKTMRAGNLAAAQKRLNSVAAQIARQGSMIDLSITNSYLKLRMHELSLAARHLQAVQAEKEAERERRAELREQRKAEAELAREHERLEKERAKYLSTLSSLEASGDEEGAARMRERLADVDKAIEDVDYRAANMRAGYVYVISNVGAFGPDTVKIGMTRRLDPMDRVRELGDASVPFRFDVHALFFADDAVGIETMLHQTFAAERVNKINTRREYFRVTPQQVLDALKSHSVEVLEFTLDPDAEEFRLSGGQVA